MTDDSMPRIFAIAGIPGAGKTTFVQKQIQAGILPPQAFIHDCDAVMQDLNEYQDDLRLHGSVFAFAKWELPARQIAEDQLAQAVEQRQDIIYDRSCALASSLGFIKNLVEEKGYQLHFYYLKIDILLAQQRASIREQTTGRHIPVAVIEERMQALQQLLPDYRKLASYWYQVENPLPGA